MASQTRRLEGAVSPTWRRSETIRAHKLHTTNMASSSVYLPGPAEARSHHHYHSMHRRSLAQHRHPSYDGLQQYPPGPGYRTDPSYYPHELDCSTSTSASAMRLGIDLAPGYDEDGAYVRHRHRQHHQHQHRQSCPLHQLPVQSSWQSETQPTWVHHPAHDTAGGEDLLPSARVLEYGERLARVAYGLYQSTTTSTTPARRDSLVTSSSSDSTSAMTSSSSTHSATTTTTTLSSPSSPSSPSSSPTLPTSPSTSPTRHVKKLPPARRSKHKPPTTQRSCAQCSATKSPTWRRGPSGLTLCNGCGLRYGQAKKTSRSMAIDSILN